MEKASKHLCPVTLELGGKSPCIVGKTANLQMAARRIVFGKLLNCGQTCVAPDYVLCHPEVKEAFIYALIEEIKTQYGENYLENENYGKIITKKHFDRITGLIENRKVVYGGESNEETLQIEPTIMDRVTWEDPIMQEEIFGPVLPILEYKDRKEIIREINSRPTPLALYVFTEELPSDAHSEEDALTILSFTLPPATWDLGAKAKAVWALIMAKPDLMNFHPAKVS